MMQPLFYCYTNKATVTIQQLIDARLHTVCHCRNAATIFSNIAVFVTLLALLFVFIGGKFGDAISVSPKDQWLFSVSLILPASNSLIHLSLCRGQLWDS